MVEAVAGVFTVKIGHGTMCMLSGSISKHHFDGMCYLDLARNILAGYVDFELLCMHTLHSIHLFQNM